MKSSFHNFLSWICLFKSRKFMSLSSQHQRTHRQDQRPTVPFGDLSDRPGQGLHREAPAIRLASQEKKSGHPMLQLLLYGDHPRAGIKTVKSALLCNLHICMLFKARKGIFLNCATSWRLGVFNKQSFVGYTAKILYRKLEKNIHRKETSRPQSQFLQWVMVQRPPPPSVMDSLTLQANPDGQGQDGRPPPASIWQVCLANSTCLL